MTKKYKTTVAMAHNIIENLNKFETLEINLPIEVGFPIIENIRRMQDALESSNKMRDKVILKHSDGTGQINQEESPEEYKACINELTKLGNMDIEIDIYTIDVDKIRTVSLPMWAMFAIGFMMDGGD